MNNIIEFRKGDYGTKAIIKTAWQDSFLKFLRDKEIKELELNDGNGWHGVNVDFLQLLPELKSLTLIDLKLKSIQGIHYLSNLQELQLITYSKFSVDFSCFPNLSLCGFEWIKGSDSLFECKNLKGLSINGYPGRNSEVLTGLQNIEKLTILNSNFEELNGIGFLNKLKYLSLANLKYLTSLNGVGKLIQLDELEIQKCKGISSISEIFKLSELKRLLLLDLGQIDSFDGIENLTKLTTLLFYESTNIVDGELSSLFKLGKLTKISFQNRRHYSHKREDFGELYS